jgi:hypothetical protein
MNIAALDSRRIGVRATLNYLVRTSDKPYAYTFDPPAGVPARSGEVDAVENVLIRDARSFANLFSLNGAGFELHAHESIVGNFYDEDEVHDIYYVEVEELLLKVTGAEKVVIFDHTIRSVPRFGAKGMREPVRRVHNDYTAVSGRRRVRDHLAPDEAEERLRHRFLEVNVWRPIVGPLQDAPLAVCDARTIAPEDLIATDLIYPDKIDETYSVSYSPAHRWYYFPKMQPDEALLIKCFDSDETTNGRFTAHTAFDDPTAPQNPLPRESIEVRALVFFAGEGGRP